jgi:hypothetical protein
LKIWYGKNEKNETFKRCILEGNEKFVCLFLKKNGGLGALFNFFQIPPLGPFLQIEKSFF